MKRLTAVLLVALLVVGAVFAQGAKGPTLRNRDADTLVFVLAAAPQPLDPNIYTTLNEAQILNCFANRHVCLDGMLGDLRR